MNRRRSAYATGLGLAALGIGTVVYVALTGGLGPWRLRPPDAAAAYPSAADCAVCHPTAAAEWEDSAHAWAGRNVLIHASVCGGCHAPVGTQMEPEYLFKATSGGDMRHLPPSAAEGVTCVVCHGATHAPEAHVLTFEPEWPNWRTTDLAVRVAAWDTARGSFGRGTAADPLPVANESHESVADDALTRAESCRTCHDVALDKGPLEGQSGTTQPIVKLLTTYAEWTDSSYPAAGRTCQSCHMPRTGEAAPAAIAPPGTTYDSPLPDRPHADHSLLGVDTAYWDPAAPQDEQARQSATHLKTAATVDIGVPETAQPGQTITIAVTMRNVGAGHDLMTGFSFWREAWLEVEVTDDAGGQVFSSGVLDADGWLNDEYSPRVRQDPSLYDLYLLQLRSRLVRSPDNLSDWMQPDRTVVVPESAIKRNLNGTPILSWSEFDTAPIVARLEGKTGPAAAAPSPLEEVYVLRFAESIIRNGIPADDARTATYPVTIAPATTGPLRVSARLLLRALGRHMTQQQEEISDDPPIEPVYELDAAHATVTINPPR